MNTQMERPSDQYSTAYEEEPRKHDHNVGLQPAGVQDEGHDDSEHHGEKKSVLKKVKAKAKKIKDTIKGHVGHGHELDHGHDHNDDEDDDDDDEMETDPDIHGVQAPQNFIEGQEGVARAGDYQTFDPTATKYIPGQEETLGWSRTDTGGPRGYEEQPSAPKNTPMTARSGGFHSTGDVETGQRGASLKLGGILERPTDVDNDPHAPKDVGEQPHPANYQAKVTDPTGTGYHSATAQSLVEGQGGITRQHGTTTAMTSHLPVSKPGDYQSFDPTTTRYVPGQDETLGWSRMDTGRPKGSEEHETTTTVTSHLPMSKHGDYQSFDPTTTRYVPKQDETLDWSRTDTGRPKGSEEQPYATRNTHVAESGITHGTGVDSGNLSGTLDQATDLEKDPHAPKDAGEEFRHAENYQTKVTDPTGRGGEEIGVTPILHQLDKMTIHDESGQNPKANIGQEETLLKPSLGEDEKLSTGSHDQFFPEPVTSETRTFLQDPSSEQKQASYTEKVSSAASMVADKAKQATTSVTSKLGYGGNGSQDRQAESSVGYGEALSNVKTAVADKAVQTKEVAATKLGYSGTDEGQPKQQPHGGEAPKSRSIVSTVKEKIAPVYEKVAGVGSVVSSRVQGSGTEHDVEPTSETDKGVSVKEYLVEKLKPGEEDKALSAVITEALPLRKRKEDLSNTGEEGEGKKVEIKGRVTESEEVVKRLGRVEETSYDEAGPGLASPGKGVIDRIKGAATSWFRKSGETQPSDIGEGNDGNLHDSSVKETDQNEVVAESGLQ